MLIDIPQEIVAVDELRAPLKAALRMEASVVPML
jgi:hypothetical protein